MGYKIFLGCLLFTILLSCKKSSTEEANPYAGKWAGIYNGLGEKGTWEATISGNGDVNGNAFSITSSATLPAVGSINKDGQVNITFGSGVSALVFTGQAAGINAAGTWVNSSTNGNWSGKIQ